MPHASPAWPPTCHILGLLVAALLALLCLPPDAGAAQPSPPLKWYLWDPAWQTVVPAARAAANRIIAGEIGPQVIRPLQEAARALPPGVPRPDHCLAMMVSAMSKRSAQRAREAVECYEGATLAETPAPQGICRDQVKVTSFQASVRGPIVSGVDPLRPNWLTLDTAKDGRPGITFTATVTVRKGKVPLDHLHLYYIQNKTHFTGTMVYDPPPHLVPVLRDGSTLPPHTPLLDRVDESERPVPMPYYNGEFQETNPTGEARQITASDSPGTAVEMTRLVVPGTFHSIHLTSTYRMFLVCADGRSKGFDVLRQLEWTVLYKGTFNRQSRTLTLDPAAGIKAQPSQRARDTPVVTLPLSNPFSTYRPAR